ncbi:MAG: putative sulfate exporter family transporter [Bacteroidota bacterium]
MSIKQLFQKEDHWAIWLGSGILLVAILLFFSAPPKDLYKQHRQLDDQLAAQTTEVPFKSIAWYEAYDSQQKIKGSSSNIGKFLGKLTSKPGSWQYNPITAFFQSDQEAELKRGALKEKFEAAKRSVATEHLAAEELEKAARDQNFQNEKLNQSAVIAIENWRAQKKVYAKVAKKYNAKAYHKTAWLLAWGLILALLFGLAALVLDGKATPFFKAFAYVFAFALLAYLLAAQANMKALGVGYAAWAILLGLLISNTIGTPEWVKPALKTELYIKTGLVLLGAEILFGKVLSIGLPGIFVAWVVTPIVLVSTFWFGQKVLKISSKTLNMTISADMSVCGVSAAVATAAACNAKKEELTLAIGLSMIFTSVMMIVMPLFINWMGMPEVLGGAWMGGTIDATGAVVAAGAFLGDTALNVAATIKMIQNILIGIVAFGVAIYFASKVEQSGQTKIGWAEIWKRFPKFILGFIGASIFMSILYAFLDGGVAYSLIDQGVIRGFSKNVRGWLFCLAFVSIGLSTNFAILRKHFTGGKPLVLYLCGQAFNLGLTLLMAYIMFYLVFSNITTNL